MALKIAQMVSHGGDLFVVSTRGEMFQRVKDNKVMAPNPDKYNWVKVAGPKDDEEIAAEARELEAAKELLKARELVAR